MSWVTVIWSMLVLACLTLATAALAFCDLLMRAAASRETDDELTVNSRSMLQIMQAFAGFPQVPEVHIKDHSAAPAFENLPATESRQKNVRIHSGKDKPANAFASVHYRYQWFWVDNRDWPTKRALTVVMFFFTLAETGDSGKPSLITIPAQ